ncbi:hypothetical protein [Rhodoferax sp.]|uniref:hypothetical protein n=1 Tax=Rhodoferax sp. TaxID=50421 RepID=UPI00272FF503|nr:hypothetical protein [Rhodoferax sp.]MDP2442394.1 hypothetical protein [Rhodoferax sp.]MDZ4209252.1 hypothetical protein [Rhodoferax sp.]
MEQQISQSEFVPDAGRSICKSTPYPAHLEKQVSGNLIFGFENVVFKSEYRVSWY